MCSLMKILSKYFKCSNIYFPPCINLIKPFTIHFYIHFTTIVKLDVFIHLKALRKVDTSVI